MSRPARAVIIGHPELAPPKSKLWAFSRADFARVFGMSVAGVKAAICRGDFDPADLLSIIDFFLHRDRKRGAPYSRRGLGLDYLLDKKVA
jgi:hypothetical protein